MNLAADPAPDIDNPPPRTSPCSPERLAWLMHVLGWGSNYLAEHKLGVNTKSVRFWLSGRREIPPNLHQWLEDLAAYHLAHREPLNWKASADDDAPAGISNHTR